MKVWKYEVLDMAHGIVFADTKEQAEEKVRNAYKEHSNGFYDDQPIIIIITDPCEDNSWFADSPDVYEVFYYD